MTGGAPAGPAPQGSVPWPPADTPDDPALEVDIDRLMVFVPAIMSVGLVFSAVTLLRDLFHWTGAKARERRTSMAAGAVVGVVLGEPEPDPEDLGILDRPLYLVSAIVLIGVAAYVAIGSIANFVRDQGYVRDIGWLLAVSLALALLLGFLGGVSLAVFRTWPEPPPWTYGSLRIAPLSTTPGRQGQGPAWELTAATIAAVTTTGVITLLVGSGRSIALRIDRPISDWFAELAWIDRLAPLDPFGATALSIGLVMLIGLSGFRCRVMAVAYPVAFLAAWLAGAAIREVIERPRPTLYGDVESFPSGHMVQTVFLAGLVPLALAVLLSDRRVATIARTVLGAAVVATALYRIHARVHWPLDALAGIVLGLSVVLATHWVLEHRHLHRDCRACPWSPEPGETPWGQGVLALGPGATRLVGIAAVVTALGSALALGLATVFIGLPTDPEGFGFGSSISRPVQLGLTAMMFLAGLAAIRWRAPAAFAMALTATGLGLFASVEYRPILALALFCVLAIPAVLTWLAWQPNESLGRIATLAAVTVTLLTVTAMGSEAIYDHYFGPTHPDSAAERSPSAADWVWLGAVDTRSATVTAGGLEPGTVAELNSWPIEASGGRPASGSVTAGTVDEYGVARFELADLDAATRYGYAVASPDVGDDERLEDGEFETFAEGPQDIVVALGSCARTGSNGAVFDAIVAEEPDLYLALGDLHYGNIDATDPEPHIDAYGRSLRQPGQAALFSSIPTAYVWDDHDYGPNDSDASSPSRSAVSEAYRRAVPHYPLEADSDGPIAQAFTVGRVRFVMADTRSQRTSASMLGAEQQEWLIEQLISSARTHALVVWVNPTPWIGAGDLASDSWAGYAEDRIAIADALARAEVENLIMVSGDAHMVAIDDGTNSGYATGGFSGFPLLHAAALDRPGSVKGGPYSHGAFPGPGQYGKLEIEDDGGNHIVVRLSGHTWAGEELVALSLRFTA